MSCQPLSDRCSASRRSGFGDRPKKAAPGRACRRCGFICRRNRLLSGGLTANECDRDMSRCRVGLGTMPMAVTRYWTTERVMELKPDFAFTPLPSIARPLRFSATGPVGSPLGLLEGLKGTWIGGGFNVIWRPNSTPGQDRFLELNLTQETLRFEEIPGPIPNRGLLQSDINMFGLWYLQTIADANIKENGRPAGLHLEPGIWATCRRPSIHRKSRRLSAWRRYRTEQRCWHKVSRVRAQKGQIFKI